MKKMLVLLSFLALSLSASTANNVDSKAVTNSDSPVLIIVATKDNCTVSTTCGNGSSISCTSDVCKDCTDIVIGALKGGFCGNQD
jgi:hypothetical protein